MKKNFMIGVLAAIFIFCSTSLIGAADVIKVGAPLALTGPYASDGVNYWNGILMAIQDLHDEGGLLGKKLKAIKFDTQDFAPERVMLAADQLIGREKVDSIHAGWAGWGQDVRAYGKYDVPTFAMDASVAARAVFREDPVKYSNFFQLADIERNISSLLFDYMVNLPYQYPSETVAIITSDDSWGTEMAAGLIEKCKRNGWEVVLHETVPYGTTEWGPIMTKVRSANPAWIYMEIVSVPENATFIRQFLKRPTESLINQSYCLGQKDYVPNLGKLAEGILGQIPGIPFPPTPNKVTADWMERYEKRFKTEFASSSYKIYEGVMIWADAVKAVGDVKDYKAIVKYLQNNKFNTPIGHAVRFNKDNILPIEYDPVNIVQIQDGKNITITNKPGTVYKDNRFILPPWIKR